MDLKTSTALVTGGSSGIGYGIAEALIQAGAKVAITGRNKSRLDKAAAELGALAVHADVSKEADVARTMQEMLAKFGHLDILVNNAGLGTFKPLLDMDLAGFQATFATNVTGAMLMAQAAARHFVERKRGNIVNIGSTASHRGAPNGTSVRPWMFKPRHAGVDASQSIGYTARMGQPDLAPSTCSRSEPVMTKSDGLPVEVTRMSSPGFPQMTPMPMPEWNAISTGPERCGQDRTSSRR